MPIIERFDSEDEAKARAGELIGTVEGPNPVYGLQTTAVLVSPYQGRWNVEIDTKLVALPPTFKGVALPWVQPQDLDSAYQKVLEENAVLRRTKARLREAITSLAGRSEACTLAVQRLQTAIKDET